MGRYDNLHGDEDEIDHELRETHEQRKELRGDEENEDWYCHQFVQPLDMVQA